MSLDKRRFLVNVISLKCLKNSLFNGLSRKCGNLSWTINFSRINVPTLRGYGCAEKPHFLCSKFAKQSRENSGLSNQTRWESRHLEKVCPTVFPVTFFHVYESSTHILLQNWSKLTIPDFDLSASILANLPIDASSVVACQLRFLPLEVHVV